MEAWNEAWATEAGRREWLEPDQFVVELLPLLRATDVARGLDLGFGVGRHAILLARQGIAVYGLDAAANGLAYANGWAGREGLSLNLMTGDMTKLPYADHFFDLILTQKLSAASNRRGASFAP